MRACVVAGLSAAYLAYVFRLRGPLFWSAGLGDWMDPYFINALLEHWYHVARSLANPASPPMFFPVRHALGYSHGLLLYAPFYVPLRAFLHPFQAQTLTLLFVIEIGIICLYLFLRRLRLSFFESALLTAFFVSSENVMNGTTAVWMQRASVFVIPPVLVLAQTARRAGGASGVALAVLAGAGASLMYVQDFYTAHFAALLAVVIAVAAVEWPAGIQTWPVKLWRRQTGALRMALIVVAVAAVATVVILMTGGGETRVVGIRLAARDWRRPALLAMLAASFLAWRNRAIVKPLHAAAHRQVQGFAVGLFIGAGVFFWIYLDAFSEHRGFPKEEVWHALVERDPYLSVRTFVLCAAVAVLAWVPWLRVDRRAKRYGLWLVAVSACVWLIPLRFGDVSIWTAFVARLPGFGVIRDPKRIIYLYELAAVIAIAAIVAPPSTRAYRLSVIMFALALMLAHPNRERFDYERSNAVFDRWVAAPTVIDPSCRSFFILKASAEYMSRSPHMGSLYGIDATFVALNHSRPTLNGYSAWYPDGWELWNPQEDTYPGRVRRWIETHNLSGVCEFDIDARTMRPWAEARAPQSLIR